MSSTKLATAKQTLLRLGVIVLSVAVLAAGCTQTEEGAPAEAEATTSITSTTPTSTDPTTPTPDNITTSTLAFGENEIPVPDKVTVNDAISERVVKLIDIAVDSCSDLYELRCGKALWNACVELKLDLAKALNFENSTSIERVALVDVTIKVLENVADGICNRVSMAFYSELSAILSAKYGNNYYMRDINYSRDRDSLFRGDRGFFNFRDYINGETGFPYMNHLSSEEISAIYDIEPEEFRIDDEEGRLYIPDHIRPKLGQLFLNLHSYTVSEIRDINLKSEGDIARILEVQSNFQEASQCLPFHLDNLRQCVIELCQQEGQIDNIDCHEDLIYLPRGAPIATGLKYDELLVLDQISLVPTRAFSGVNLSMSVLAVQILKYVCATGEVYGNAHPDDECRKTALELCQNLDFRWASDIRILMPIDEEAICLLATKLKKLQYIEAANMCIEQLENYLSYEASPFSLTNYCADAALECATYNYGPNYTRDQCKGYANGFAAEIIWKNISLLCTEIDNSISKFSESNCYDKLQNACANIWSNPTGDIYTHVPLEKYVRSAYEIGNILCHNFIDFYDPLDYNKRIDLPDYLLDIPPEFEGDKWSITDTNSIKTIECSESQIIQSECVETLWIACFTILPSVPFANFELAHYICDAAWLSELIRTATVFSTNFPRDHQVGTFNKFYDAIITEAFAGGLNWRVINDPNAPGGLLMLDQLGRAHPNINKENIWPDILAEINESLNELATSLAQLIQPYIRLPAANQQSNI